MATLKFRCARLAESEDGESFSRELYFNTANRQGQPLVDNVKGGSMQITVSGSDDYFKNVHVGSIVTLETSGEVTTEATPAPVAPAPVSSDK